MRADGRAARVPRRIAAAARWVVYIVEGPRGLLYTGVSTDVARRLREHASGARGARFFRFGKPKGLRYVETATDRASAQRREAAIKRLPRLAKLALIASYLARA